MMMPFSFLNAYGEVVRFLTGDANSTQLFYSPDGTTSWTQATSNLNGIGRLASKDGLIYAITAQGGPQSQNIYRSSDGITYSSVYVNALGSNPDHIDNCDGLLIGLIGRDGSIPGQLFLTSPDGTTWTLRGPSVSTDARLNSSTVRTTSLRYVSVGYSLGSGGMAYTSTNGTTWVTTPIDTSYIWQGCAYGNGVFVAVGGNNANLGAYTTSTDGLTWTTPTTLGLDDFRSVIFANGQFMMVTASRVYTSTNGTTWTVRNSTALSQLQCQDVDYYNGVWVVVGNSGNAAFPRIAFSTDNGVTWTSFNSGNRVHFSVVARIP